MKLYVPDFSLSNRGNLFPLLKPFYKSGNFTDAQRIAMYGISEQDVKLVKTIPEADYVILPLSWNYYVNKHKIQEALQVLQLARQYNKTVWSFTHGDFGVRIPKVNNLVVFRANGEKSKLPNYHKGMPVFIKNPLEAYYQGKVITRKYTSIPTVGFCGQANAALPHVLSQYAKTAWRNLKYYTHLQNNLPQPIQSTSYLRYKILTKLEQAPGIQTNFIKREKYRAGVQTPEQRMQTTKEFYNNMVQSDYVLCFRGGGNFSVRFYEALAMGRIPVFVNTDCLLPLADSINWKKHVVWVEYSELNRIGEKILSFHNQLNQERFALLQESIHKIWEQYLRLGGFFKKLF